jgi:hypothetical protein
MQDTRQTLQPAWRAVLMPQLLRCTCLVEVVGYEAPGYADEGLPSDHLLPCGYARRGEPLSWAKHKQGLRRACQQVHLAAVH